MLVMEKGRDIAILKSMGATSASIMKIFFLQGLVISVTGTVLGVLGGLGLCELLSRYQFIELPSNVYPMTTLPIKVLPTDVSDHRLLLDHHQPLGNDLSIMEGVEGEAGGGALMSPPLMQATDLRKTYANGLREVEVLKGIDLAVEPGEMTAIIGASGSGKTTLLQILGTLAAHYGRSTAVQGQPSRSEKR